MLRFGGSVHQQPQRAPFSDAFFRSSSSQWRNTQQSKDYPNHSYSKYRSNACSAQELLKSRGLLLPAEKEGDGELSLHIEEQEEEKEENENAIRMMDSDYNNGQEEVVSSCNYQKPHLHENGTSEAASFVASLKVCAEHADLERGLCLHAQIVGTGLLEKNVFVGSSLINMYGKCGAMEKAHELFDELPVRNVVLWNVLVAGYVYNGHGKEALKCFDRMQLEGFPPNEATFSCVLKACGSLGYLNKGQDVHTRIIEEHLLEKNTVVAHALIDMYAKCGALQQAQTVLDELPLSTVVSWTVLISGYTQHGCGEEALLCFERMQARGLSPDAATFACVLKACSSLRALEKGREVHLQIVRAGLLDIHVGTALVDMYAKCGALQKAQEVFDMLPIRNSISWNALISGYAQHRYGEEALICFEWMQYEGLSPDTVTFICILKACSSIGAACKGKEMHANIVKHGLSKEGFVTAATALVDMYANFGMLAEAQYLFEKLPVRDVVSWSVLMEGYAHLGKEETVFGLYAQMVNEDTVADLATITIVLNTCSQIGLLRKGETFFEFITKSQGIAPASEHYTCMVDLFARAGCLDKAVAVVEHMPLSADLTMWHSLLGACRKWGYTEPGRWAFEHAVQVDETAAGAYICISNIYAAAPAKRI